jgi:pullulanase
MHRNTVAACVALAFIALTGCSGEKARLFTPAIVGAGGSVLPQRTRLLTVEVPEFLDGRTCWVYLPPGYAPAIRRYPVLYMHDGPELFGPDAVGLPTWHMEDTCDSLISGGIVAPFIIVGIRNSDRFYEYTPFDDPYNPGTEGGGDAYLRAIRDALKPNIDRYFATIPDASHTIIAGSSLGGLISMYAGYAYDEVFGRVGSFSGSYSWDYGQFYAFVAANPSPSIERMYVDAGTVSDNTFSAYRMRDIAIDQGFVLGVDLMFVIGSGHNHTPTYWGQRFPEAIKFLMSGLSSTPAP